MQIKLDGKRGVIIGTDWTTRQRFAQSLGTTYDIKGDRIYFDPTRASLDLLVENGAKFDGECRTAWGHFYKAKTPKDYDFNFVTVPYDHQFKVWEKIKDMEFFALEWEMGLGKTKTLLDVAAWKRQQGEIDALVVVTLAGVHRNWIAKEIPIHWPDDSTFARAWMPNRVEKGMRGIVESKEFVIATMNFEATPTKDGLAFLQKILKARRCMLVIDESHLIKTPGSKRTKAMLKVAQLAVCRFTATGTPVPKDALDLWAPYRFLSQKLIYEPYFAFRARYAVMQDMELQDRRIKVVVGQKNQAELKARIDPHRSRLLKDDVLDLPEKTYRERIFDLTPAQKRAYNQMLETLLIELEGYDIVTAEIAMTKTLRLRQLTCGFVQPLDKDPRSFEGKNPRLDAMLDEISNVHGKAIIWCPFRFTNQEILRRLREGYDEDSVRLIDGTTNADDDERNSELFQNTDRVRWLIGSQRKMGTGYTLTAAQDALYPMNALGLVLRLQSEDRIHRIGQTGTCTYTDFRARGCQVDKDDINRLIKRRDDGAALTGDDLRDWLKPIK